MVKPSVAIKVSTAEFQSEAERLGFKLITMTQGLLKLESDQFWERERGAFEEIIAEGDGIEDTKVLTPLRSSSLISSLSQEKVTYLIPISGSKHKLSMRTRLRKLAC